MPFEWTLPCMAMKNHSRPSCLIRTLSKADVVHVCVVASPSLSRPVDTVMRHMYSVCMSMCTKFQWRSEHTFERLMVIETCSDLVETYPDVTRLVGAGDVTRVHSKRSL